MKKNVIKRKIKRRFGRRRKKKTKIEKKIYKICIIFILFLLNTIMYTPILDNLIIFGKNKIKNNISNNGRFFLCTTYNNEAEMIYIHLWRLYDYVDKFIIIISNITYSGLPKTFTFKSFEKNIKPYMKLLILIIFAIKMHIQLLIKFGVLNRAKEIIQKFFLKKSII